MRNLISLKLASATALAAVFCVVYYVLFSDSFMHISVGSILAQCHELSLKKHLLVLGLIPIYIALMIFGAAVLGMYIGTMLQSFLDRASKKTLKNQTQA